MPAMTDTDHETMMRQALALGEAADKEGDMGVGAVIVRAGKVIGRGRNRMHTRRDPLVHAETDAIADACKALATDDLSGSTLYTTMEPCPMCAGAMMNAKIGHWVMGGRFKAVGRRYGQYSVESFLAFVESDIKVTAGILPEECQALRNRYFARK
jgi:tRNA(adenine34) deaminase